MAESSKSSIVEKCAQVMDIVCSARNTITFSEIVEKTGFVKSSAHRILAVLQHEGLIDYDKGSRTYQVGQRMNGWAHSILRRVDLQRIASDAMHSLSEKTQMNAALSIFDRHSVLYLRTVDYTQFRYASHAGDHAPLHCTAAGKVFLAFMNERILADTLKELKFEQFTEFTHLEESALHDELIEVRKKGFATAFGEELLQVSGIAAPIWSSEDKVTACLSLWSQVDHSNSRTVLENEEALLEASYEISNRLGWSHGKR